MRENETKHEEKKKPLITAVTTSFYRLTAYETKQL